MLVDLGAVPAGPVVGLVLAQDPAPPPGKGEEFGKASPIGLVVLLLLLLATVLLVRSMNKHLRRVPESFDERVEPGDTSEAPATTPSDASAIPSPQNSDETPDGRARA